MMSIVPADVEATAHLPPTDDTGFGVDVTHLSEINEHKSKDDWANLGGLKGAAAALNTSLVDGIDPASIEQRQAVFGANKTKQVPGKSFFVLWFTNLKDPIILLLMAAALVSTILGVAIPEERQDSAWVEGVAIWVAVLVVSLVGAGNDWSKDKQFQKLNAVRDIIDVKVIRGGKQLTVKNFDVVVGDLMELVTGDKVIADGYTTEVHNLTLDEASLTGEADPMKKGEEQGDPWVRSGTQVTEGSGRVLVVAVGEHSEWGRTMALVVGESGETPLQEKLAVLAMAIGKVGLVVGVVCFFVLLIRWIVENQGFPIDDFANGPLEFFIFAITIIVVAVPEGLPLAVTISLAYSVGKMMKDNNFVRVLAACETMGGATAICSDKTGTLTENRMTVVEGWFCGKQYSSVPAPTDLPDDAREQIALNCALNSKAFLVEAEDEGGRVGFVGNRTECALLLMLNRDWGDDYKARRDFNHANTAEIYGFTSERKMASMLLKTPTGYRLYNKGAAEMVLTRCVAYIGPDGSRVPFSEAAKEDMINNTVTQMASRGLRTLCLSYVDFPENDPSRPADYFKEPHEENLTALCIVGIKDPVRKEVPDAVRTCQQAGIMIRMVTGDNIHTAQHIARECGILKGGLAMEGPDFRSKTQEELMALLPDLQVLARSSPQDKYILVQTLKRMGQVVAVTGDGTNDAPALKESDVGLAMGIAGTEVAKEAADIVILDDNFSSIVKSVLWGRCVFSNIRKFLQFQLTINLVALIVAFVCAVGSGETPLNVLQLLWVNLIMDSLAALALATENPTPELLKQRPHGRNEPLINGKMAKHILVQGAYQCFWLFLIFYGLPAHISRYHVPGACEWYGANEYNPANVTGSLCCQQGSDQCNGINSDYYTLSGGLPPPTPVCVLTQNGGCTITAPSKSQYCGEGVDSCDAYSTVNSAYDTAEKDYQDDRETDQEKTNSVVFNTFIFLQLFNEINSRKINDEYNVFDGIFASPVFATVWVITVILQVIIIFFVGDIFHTTPQNGAEWGFAVGVGASCLIVSFLTRFISRTFFPVSEAEEAQAYAERAAAPIQYREHFWQILRPVKKKEEFSSVEFGTKGPRTLAGSSGNLPALNGSGKSGSGSGDVVALEVVGDEVPVNGNGVTATKV